MKARPTTTEHKKRATRATMAARVADVLRVRLDGALPHQLREYVRQQEAAGTFPWKLEPGEGPLSDAQLYRYAVAADKQLLKGIEKDRGKLLARHLAQRHALFARAVNTGQLSVAAGLLKDEATLLGLYPKEPARVELAGPLLNVEIVNAMPEDERLRHLRRLIALAKTRGAPLLPYTNTDDADHGHQADGAGGISDR
jgi:hypothetical protein